MAIFSFTFNVVSVKAATKISVNGNLISSDAIIINGTTYAPVRAIGEALGANVTFSQEANTVNINKSIVSSENDIPMVLEKVNPFVVGIIGVYNSSAQVNYQSQYLDGISHGTGVIISSDGLILTNAHVVKDLKSIVVVMFDGKAYEAKLIAIDEFSDLAAVKIDKTNLSTAKFANSNDIYTGQSVLAIGTPLSMSFRNTVSFGIISGVNRGIGSNYRLIQTDAAINPGNSGGPLVNMNGDVIGINSNKFVGTSIEGMGFAIPVDTVNYVLNQFNSNGRVIRPQIGATFEEDIASRLGIVSNNGITIKSFDADSALQASGAKIGDKLLSVNSQNLNSIIDLNEIMKSFTPGSEVKIKIRSNSQDREILVKLK